MKAEAEKPIVSGEWLDAQRDDPDLRIVDASWHHPSTGLDAHAIYREGQIPGAVFFDIDAVASRIGELPHMLPDAATFAAGAGALGLSRERRIVFYDQNGIQSAAARAWWTFRLFGYERVAVLDGGLPRWKAEGRTLADRARTPAPVEIEPLPAPPQVRGFDEVLAKLDDAGEQLVDARSAGRFHGRDEEPWGEPGRIPGSLNLPYEELLDPGMGTLLPAVTIRARFEDTGVDLSRPIVCSCGSGVTACVLLLGLVLIGKTDAALYDGSWVEWLRREDAPRIGPEGASG